MNILGFTGGVGQGFDRRRRATSSGVATSPFAAVVGLRGFSPPTVPADMWRVVTMPTDGVSRRTRGCFPRPRVATRENVGTRWWAPSMESLPTDIRQV